MKVFEKLFKKKKDERPGASQEVTIDESLKWVDQRLTEEIGDPGFDADALLSQMRSALSALEERVDELVQTSPVKAKGRENKIIEFNKNNIARQVKVFLDNAVLPKKSSFKELQEFHSRTEHSLQVCIENSMKSYQYTKVLLPSSKRIIEHMKEIHRLLEQLRTHLEHKAERIGALEDARHMLLELQQKQRALEDQEAALRELLKRVRLVEEELDKLDGEIEELRSNKEWREYEDLKLQEKELRYSQKRIIEQIGRQMAPLAKVLKRLEKQHKSKRHMLSEERIQALTQLLEAPESAENLSSLLAYLKEVIQQSDLGINQQRIDKTIKHIDHLIDSRIIEELQRKHSTTTQRLAEINKSIEETSVVYQIEEVERLKSNKTATLNRLKEDAEGCRMRIAQLNEEITRLEEQVQEAIHLLSHGAKSLVKSSKGGTGREERQ